MALRAVSSNCALLDILFRGRAVTRCELFGRLASGSFSSHKRKNQIDNGGLVAAKSITLHKILSRFPSLVSLLPCERLWTIVVLNYDYI